MNRITITDLIIAIGALFTAILAFVAIFQDWIRARIMHPTLVVSFILSPPDCQKALIRIEKEDKENDTKDNNLLFSESYYFRIRVANTGNIQANNVEVFATGLFRLQADGSYKLVEEFYPTNFVWSHIGLIYLPVLSPYTEKLCDFARIIDPKHRKEINWEDRAWPNISEEKTILSFTISHRPFTMNYLVPYGEYKLEFLVAASNSKPVKKELKINVTGDWYDNDEKMLGEGIGILLS